MNLKRQIIRAQFIDKKQQYSLKEVSMICDIDTKLIIEMVEFGIIEPYGKDPQQWIFDETALQRSKTALRLHRDLNIHLSGLGLALDLIEEMEKLKLELKSLKQQLRSLIR